MTDDDLARERQVEAIVRENLPTGRTKALCPDMPIEPGDETDAPLRKRGWTHWHHLFGARQLLFKFSCCQDDVETLRCLICYLSKSCSNRSKRLCDVSTSSRQGDEPTIQNIFSIKHSIRCMYIGVRASIYANSSLISELSYRD